MKRVTIRYYLIIKWLVLLLNCPYCNSEIDNKDDNCCSKCGKSFCCNFILLIGGNFENNNKIYSNF